MLFVPVARSGNVQEYSISVQFNVTCFVLQLNTRTSVAEYVSEALTEIQSIVIVTVNAVVQVSKVTVTTGSAKAVHSLTTVIETGEELCADFESVLSDVRKKKGTTVVNVTSKGMKVK
jgi:hypothetical protein